LGPHHPRPREPRSERQKLSPQPLTSPGPSWMTQEVYEHQGDGGLPSGRSAYASATADVAGAGPVSFELVRRPGEIPRRSAQTCFGLSTRTRRKTPSDLLSADTRARGCDRRRTASLRRGLGDEQVQRPRRGSRPASVFARVSEPEHLGLPVSGMDSGRARLCLPPTLLLLPLCDSAASQVSARCAATANRRDR
jgi:hypothetical protein